MTKSLNVWVVVVPGGGDKPRNCAAHGQIHTGLKQYQRKPLTKRHLNRNIAPTSLTLSLFISYLFTLHVSLVFSSCLSHLFSLHVREVDAQFGHVLVERLDVEVPLGQFDLLVHERTRRGRFFLVERVELKSFSLRLWEIQQENVQSIKFGGMWDIRTVLAQNA